MAEKYAFKKAGENRYKVTRLADDQFLGFVVKKERPEPKPKTRWFFSVGNQRGLAALKAPTRGRAADNLSQEYNRRQPAPDPSDALLSQKVRWVVQYVNKADEVIAEKNGEPIMGKDVQNDLLVFALYLETNSTLDKALTVMLNAARREYDSGNG